MVETFVEGPGGADEGDVGQGLREITEVFAARAELLGVEAEVVGIAEGFFKDETGLLQIVTAGEALDIPKGTH